MDRAEKMNALEKIGQLFDKVLVELENHEENGNDFKTKSTTVNRGLEAIQLASQQNSWFTIDSIKSAMNAWSNSLQSEKIEKWLSSYSTLTGSEQKVGVIMAGNIPFVGLHDALSVLVSGGILKAKLSSKDQVLMSWILEAIAEIAPKWGMAISIVEQMKDIDCLIATGSNNSARYFDYYFKSIPKIIRKNRTSVAVLDGTESKSELEKLSEDIFTHFGLGCRNVTKVFVPKDYDLNHLFEAFYPYKEIVNHHKYANNYDYNKAVYMLNKESLIENGFLLMKEDKGLQSPVGVLFYEYYESLEQVNSRLEDEHEQIQLIAGNNEQMGFIPFGKAQQPDLWNYADRVDTLDFLLQSTALKE